MKMKCLRTSMFRGDIVKAGTILDLNEEEAKTDVVKAFFKSINEDATSGAKVSEAAPHSSVTSGKVLVAGLTRDQVMMKLNQAGVAVKGNMSNKALADLFATTFANIAEATQKED